MDMSSHMTHYMELLMTNQPWNLIIYMAVPVILAEIIAISELYLLFTGKNSGAIKTLSTTSGIIVGCLAEIVSPLSLISVVSMQR